MSELFVTSEAVLLRLREVERQNRFLRRAFTAVLLLGGALLLMGQAISSDTVRTNAFVLTDKTGRERAWLDFQRDDSAALRFAGKDGKDRIRISVRPNGSPTFSL